MTPSYNQGQFLEETIQSVLGQQYPDLEYFIFDGGSTDDSRAIVEKYQAHLAGWESAPDRGQSHAINKGFARATGELLAWLNSDDAYEPGALRRVAEAYRANPGSIIAGPVLNFRADGYRRLVEQRGLSLEATIAFWRGRVAFHQPGIFFPRRAVEQVGLLDESLRYSMDYDLLCRLLQVSQATIVAGEPLARFRLHGTSKTEAEGLGMFLETISVSRRYWDKLDAPLEGTERELRRFAADRLVRSAGTAALRGDAAEASACLRGALGFGAPQTVGALVSQLAAGLRRA